MSLPKRTHIFGSHNKLGYHYRVEFAGQLRSEPELRVGQRGCLHTGPHSVVLSGLTPSTTYHYQVLSQDGSGNLAISGDFTFTTLATGARHLRFC